MTLEDPDLLLPELVEDDLDGDLRRMIAANAAEVAERIARELRAGANPTRAVRLLYTFSEGTLASLREVDSTPEAKNSSLNFGGLAGGQGGQAAYIRDLMAQFTPFFEQLTGSERPKKISALLQAIASAKEHEQHEVAAQLQAELDAEMKKGQE
jgi:hypothetical protein